MARASRAPRWPPKDSGFALPTGAWDSHFHVFSPVNPTAYSPARDYDPPDVGLPEIVRLHDRFGFARGVIVQSAVYGTDNRVMAKALRAAGDRYRGIAVVGADVGDRELDDLAAAGVRGVRINLLYGGGVGFDVARAVEPRVRARGWHIQLLIDIATADLPWDWIEAATVPVVFDHFGHFDASLGPGSPGFQRMLRLAREGRAWVKLSGPTRISRAPAPEHSDVRPLAEALIAAAPERLVWGSDWPHVALWDHMPDDGDLVADIARWVPDGRTRRRVLVENSAVLYR